MQFKEAGEYMMSLVTERVERFSGLGLTVKIERDLMDKMFSHTENERAARFITASLVISADNDSTDEYALSLSAEIKHGEVNEDELSKSLKELDTAIEETVARLSASEDAGAEVSVLCRESEAEYDLFLGEMKKSNKKAMIRSVVFSGLIFIIMIILSLVTKYAAG